MSYALLEKNDLTSVSPEGTVYLGGWDRFRPSYTDTIDYPLTRIYQVESASWQTQYTAVDVQLLHKFNKLAKKWKRETMHCSLVKQMVLHPAYQEMIGLGPKVIPLILKELKKEPDFWFWALRSLTGVDPTTEDMHGDVMGMRNAWLNWGRENGYF